MDGWMLDEDGHWKTCKTEKKGKQNFGWIGLMAGLASTPHPFPGAKLVYFG
jgi:hypothetical protein